MSDLKPPVLKSWERSDFMLICTSLILPPCVSVLKLIIFFIITLFHVFIPHWKHVILKTKGRL